MEKPLLTLFAVPKPFDGHIDIIQRNAVASWTRLSPRPEIILFGDEKGTEEIAGEMGVSHAADVVCNQFGTPLVNDMFSRAQALHDSQFYCYVNADIIFMPNFVLAVELMARECPYSLQVAHRWDIDVTKALDFSNGWEESLLKKLDEVGHLHGSSGIDFFVFPKGFWGELPPFAVGRPAYDNWLLFRARQMGSALVDLSPVVKPIHQNHHYGHNPQGKRGIWDGPEAQRNRELAGGQQHLFMLDDATHELTMNGVKRVLQPWRLRRHLQTLPVFYPFLKFPAWLLGMVFDLFYPLAAWCKRCFFSFVLRRPI